MGRCECCNQTGHILGLGAMRKTCPECNGTRFVSSAADVKRVRKPAAKRPSRAKAVDPVDSNVVNFGE